MKTPPVICPLCNKPVLSGQRYRLSSEPSLSNLVFHANCDAPEAEAVEVTGEQYRRKDGMTWKLDPGGKY